jgi:hypothetical protein
MEDLAAVAQDDRSGRSGAALPTFLGDDGVNSTVGQIALDTGEKPVRNVEATGYVFERTAAWGDVTEIYQHAKDVEVFVVLMPQTRTRVPAVNQ